MGSALTTGLGSLYFWLARKAPLSRQVAVPTTRGQTGMDLLQMQMLSHLSVKYSLFGSLSKTGMQRDLKVHPDICKLRRFGLFLKILGAMVHKGSQKYILLRDVDASRLGVIHV